jgi:hypothetical protein
MLPARWADLKIDALHHQHYPRSQAHFSCSSITLPGTGNGTSQIMLGYCLLPLNEAGQRSAAPVLVHRVWWS